MCEFSECLASSRRRHRPFQAKRVRKGKRVEELPSFLLHLTDIPEDVNFPPRPARSNLYLGPVFLGKNNENHPPHHSVNFSTFHIEKEYQIKENIRNLFLPKTAVEKPKKASKAFRLLKERKRTYTDSHLHRSPGTRKAFKPEVKPPATDLGESASVIEGETVLEIPLYRLKKSESGSHAPEFELVNFSDIKEKRRMFMSYKERISHIHFPKEFATVTVVGPKIPAAITITKLPSKRKTQSVVDLLNKPNSKKSSTVEAKVEEKTDELTEEPEEAQFSIEENDTSSFSDKGSIDTEKNLEIQIIQEAEEEIEDGLQEFSSEQIEEDIKETMGEISNEDTVESGEFLVEKIKAEETEVNEKTEENGEQLQRHPEEDERRKTDAYLNSQI